MTEPGLRGKTVPSAPPADPSALRRSSARHDGEPLPRAEVCETHTAIVFFAGDRAYKLKKPVDVGFLDYTPVTARRAACEREVALNRRFAPDVYLGLGEIHSPDAEAPEPLVVMRRMPADRRLSRLVREGAAVDDILRAVARQLAAWHAQAPRSRDVDEQGTRDALSSRWEASFAQVRTLADDGYVPDGVAEAERLARRYLAGRKRLFDTRVEQGRVVDGHGDLLAEDIFCLDDGPRVLDCLEFDDHLRYVDGLDDAAFLAMDLEQLGAPQAAAYFLARYSEFSGDPAPPSLWHHYVAYRAFVRAKVCLIQARQGAPDAEAASRRLVSTALRHLRTSAVGLTLVGGLPGSGKSTLSGALADRLGVTLLSSDRLRKELAGIPAEQSAVAGYREGLYTPEWTARTYATLLDRAAALLSCGESVVLDATWSDAGQREAALRVAERTGADLVALHCRVPGDVSAARLSTRAPGTSDAGPGIATAMAAREPPWPEAVAVDTNGSLESAVAQALAAVRPWGQFYADFSQTDDDEVVACLEEADARPVSTRRTEPRHTVPEDREADVQAGAVVLRGQLTVPEGAAGVVLFAHGSGSSPHSPRNRFVAAGLNRAGLGTLLFDLLTEEEETDRANVFDTGLLARRLVDATGWLRGQPETEGLAVGYFGASTGAAAALWAAAEPGARIAAVVSRGGRPDLAGPRLPAVTAPTLLIVGSHDELVLELNRDAQSRLRCENRLAVVPGATHLFEEPGALEKVTDLARDWFTDHMAPVPHAAA